MNLNISFKATPSKDGKSDPKDTKAGAIAAIAKQMKDFGASDADVKSVTEAIETKLDALEVSSVEGVSVYVTWVPPIVEVAVAK